METNLGTGRQVVGAKRRRVLPTSVQPCPPPSIAPHCSQSPYPHGPPYPPYHHRVHLGDPPVNMVPENTHEYRYHRPDDLMPIQDHRDSPPRAHASSYPLSTRDIKSEPQNVTALQPIRYMSSPESFIDGLLPVPNGLSHRPHDGSRRPLDLDAAPHVPNQHDPQRFTMHSHLPPPGDHPRRPLTPVQQRLHYVPSHLRYAQPAPISVDSLEIARDVATKRTLRTLQACDRCRQHKVKCDEYKPCKNCKEKNIECCYQETPPKPRDKTAPDTLDMMREIKNQMNFDFTRMAQNIEEKNKSREKRMETLESCMVSLEKALVHGAVGKVRENAANDEYTHYCDYSSELHMNREPGMTEKVKKVLQEANAIEIETNPGAPVEPGRPTIPVNHTTLTGLLLEWPAITNLVGPILKQKQIYSAEEFPTHQEQQRGLLRVHGRGEGLDIGLPPRMEEPSLHSSITDVNEQLTDEPTLFPGGSWGQVGSLSEDSAPEFDPHKVKEYVQSFKDNILAMHPILILEELDALVAMFLQNLHPKPDAEQPTSESSSGIKVAVYTSVGTHAAATEGGMKRKLPAAVGEHPPVSLHRLNLPSRNIQSAMVLTVLALGKICLHRDKIPGLVPETDQPKQWSPPGLCRQGSPPAKTPQPPISSLPLPKEHRKDQRGRKPSRQSSEPFAKAKATKRNIDQIPGLEYFALATDIVGGHMGGTTLKHVYTWLFMGLYHGQLGRVMESWNYISNACRVLAVCLRPSQGRLVEHATDGKGLKTERDNQLAFAYWSCLQLECDILAELRLPQSPLLNFEEQMPYPNLGMVVGYPVSVMSSYSAQLYLRKQLNQIHSMLYGSKTLQSPKESVEEKIQTIQASLAHSRGTWVPHQYQWNDEDPPADNTLAARLRAKYWGSQVILFRPYLDAVLHPEKSTHGLFAPQPVTPLKDPQVDLSKHLVPHNMDQCTWPRALTYARRGVRALVESTRSFHGLDPTRRFIVTSHFTTAHAQWGNLLCLAACWRHPILGQMLDKNTLAKLFTHTIKFFDYIVTQSSALNTERDMLIEVRKMLGLGEDDVV